MDTLHSFLDIFLHLNAYLATLLAQYGTLTYAILFFIIFCETGSIFFPFLPGDSLLFAVGALAASTGQLAMPIVIPLLITAALFGDNVNYGVGKFFGIKIKQKQRILFFKAEHITKTESYYAKYGGRTIIMARFIPIIRGVAPFVAGAGNMSYKTFVTFCIAGAIAWVSSLTTLGYQFGHLEVVKKHFEFIILGIIFISFLPVFYSAWQAKRATS